jgi:hypothetical protein
MRIDPPLQIADSFAKRSASCDFSEKRSMSDIRSETLMTLSKAAEKFPGGERHVSTIHRYRLHGVGGIRLECLRLGGRWYTSAESVDRWVTQLNANRAGSESSLRTSSAASTGFAAADKDLKSEQF